MEKIFKDTNNILYVAIVVIAFAAGAYFTVTKGIELVNNITEMTAKQEELNSKKGQLEQLKAQKMAAPKKKEQNEDKNAKVIYEVLGQQFSPEASFGIMFENMLSNITNSGVRIRDIGYNYSPADDLVLQTNAPGYNACELSFTTVSSYSQLLNFFKNLAKETYLTGINEIFIEPYEDKSILIARFKVRLYTKTI